MISPGIFAIVRCPDCAGALAPAGEVATCAGCGRPFDMTAGYLDLRPGEVFAEQTKYLDPALHADARHASIAPAVLGSKIRQDMLRRFLSPGPSDRVIDLGCGSGRALAWNTPSGASLTGIDISPHFAREALADHDLVLGDLRRLPMRDAVFTKAWTLDVIEHVSPEALAEVLAEANRVLVPGGALFAYSHVRRNGWIAGGVRLVNRLAAGLDRLGLLDLRQERLRKSDHVNPLADHDALSAAAARAGFRIERITYYTPIIGALVENVLVRLAERWLARRAAAAGLAADAGDEAALKAARAAGQARVAARGVTYRVLLGLTML
ncbi:MAG TPA: class I SAM-dependent methyltransferase, partial [Vicinamibacterales bacterium]|nr:class I SAM-dependent methyltransferase [Vicinamibacterales bacterium]